ncbi:hypothetical protein [Algicola sagamiensis]|uniref:hypothetical protein n=1 Tax=Algicola sagamiensis TaxID=163869 RepID=UPI00037748E3|nr:hypothetical protein [Algicola sagamiensis]
MLKQLSCFLAILLLLMGCESKEEKIKKAIATEANIVESRLSQLETDLQAGKIKNAQTLTNYAQQLSTQCPEAASIAQTIAQDATPQGPLFQSLKKRLQSVKEKANRSLLGWEENLDEITALKEAATADVFNDALSDPVNVLADISAGKLNRINAVSKEDDLVLNRAQNFGPGSQLIGNLNYGEWRLESSGRSYWIWNKDYAGLKDLDENTCQDTPQRTTSRSHHNRHYYGGGFIYYNSWAPYRSYSYYHDYGRYRYSSPKQLQRQSNLYTKTKKDFSTQGKRFSSPYASKKSGQSRLSRSSFTPSKAGSYSGRSIYGSGSLRNSSSRTSRGLSGGK